MNVFTVTFYCIKEKIDPGFFENLEGIAHDYGLQIEKSVTTNYQGFEEKKDLTLEDRRAFLNLPLAQRRLILEKQANELAKYYQEENELKGLDGGDFIDY